MKLGLPLWLFCRSIHTIETCVRFSLKFSNILCEMSPWSKHAPKHMLTLHFYCGRSFSWVMSNASLKCVYWLLNEVHSRPKSFIRFCSHMQETDYLRLSLFRSFLKPCCLYGCSFVVCISGQLEEAAAMQLRYGSHFQLEDGDHWAEYAGSGIPASPACGISSEMVSIIVNALFAWSISYLL